MLASAAIATYVFLQAQVAAPAPAAATAGYWQQDVRYAIRAALDESSGVLTAAGRMVYRNNSPDTLRRFYLHLYMNAFRPASRWAAAELREGIERFAHLPDPYHGFERLGRVAMDGAPVAPGYPFAPDSTVAAFDLPRPLAPGDSLVVDLEWRSRPSAIPRRQGREGRRFDFTQWYPKVVVYDRGGWQVHPLYMAGEFYGEFATYDVALDLEADQVVGATGVPVEGDPGWSAARATPETPVTPQSDWYGDGPRGGALAEWGAPQPGRRRVRFHAERVHDFAWSANPEYVYEEGRFGPTVLRTLYLPQDRATWGGGIVIQRMARLMAWMDTVFGAYPWPQFTALHRIEGGGTEFPMVVMNGGPSEGLIFHEGTHQYTYGILANNEWRDGWFDEGFASFQGSWASQRRGARRPSPDGQLPLVTMDLDGWSEPLSTPAELYPDFDVYGNMIYSKGSLLFEMLRYVVGEDAFRRGLRELYARRALRHVDEDALRYAMEDVSHLDLSGFFAQWLHGTPLVDYALRGVRRSRVDGGGDGGDGGWLTRIEIERRGDGVMPVDIAVPAGDTTLVVRAQGLARREVVEVRTARRTGTVELDPERRTMDWNYLNNREGPRLPLVGMLAAARQEHRLGWSATQPARRDRRVVNWLPTAWFNDIGGVTLGFQSRSSYMGRLDLGTARLSWPTGLSRVKAAAPGEVARLRPDWYLSVRNPVALRAPRRELELASWALEGRLGARIAVARDLTRHYGSSSRERAGLALELMAVTDARYLSSDRWSHWNTVEATAWAARSTEMGTSRSAARVELAVGEAFRLESPLAGDTWPGPGAAPEGLTRRRLSGASYARGRLEARREARVGAFDLRLRGVAAGTVGGTAVPLQRRVFLAGADAYATFSNPFLRSRGALLARGGAHYQAAGGAGLRALRAELSASWAVALDAEAGLRLVERPRRRWLSRVSVVAFADVAALDRAALHRVAAADAGVGVRAAHRLGPTRFVTRLDLPLLASRPGAAVGAAAGDGTLKLRWVWSLEEAF